MAVLTVRRPQYSTLIRTSIGQLHTDKRFLTRNSRRDSVTSAMRATANVRVDRVRPMTVRYWKCQPYAWLLVQISMFRPHKANGIP